MNPSARQLKLIEADVRRIYENAAYVLIMNSEKSFSLVSNPGARLNVIAVIGPAIFKGREIEKALLLEVGIGKTRPYHRSKGVNNGQKLPEIPKRRKLFGLTAKQYRLVAPALLGLFLEIATEKVAAWTTPPFFKAETESVWFSAKRKKTVVSARKRSYPRGIWFGVLHEDVFLAADLLWAETQQNETIKRVVGGLAGFIGKRLSLYLGKRRRRGIKQKHGGRGKSRTVPNWSGRKSFSKLVGVCECQNAVARAKLPGYLRKMLMVKFDARNPKHPFFPWVVCDIICPPPEKTREEYLLETALLPGPEKRIPKGLQVSTYRRLTPQGNGRLVFELFPFATKEEWQKEKEKKDGNNPVEVPF